MNDIPGLNLLPEKYRGYVALAVPASFVAGRVYHSLANGGGLRGVLASIWLGTNVPKPQPSVTSSNGGSTNDLTKL